MTHATEHRVVDYHYRDGWEMRGEAMQLWLDLFAGNGPLDDRMAYGLYIARKALEATQEAK